MENWTNPQNEMFKNIFGELKKQSNIAFTSDALAMLKLNDENFIELHLKTTEITGDAEDIDLCYQRARHLGII